MRYLSVLIITVAIATTQGRYATGEQAGTPQAHLSRHQLHDLMNETKTPEQYQFLARYFLDRERKYDEQAKQQRVEWARRFATHGYSGGTKNASPQDSAKQICDYCQKKARQMEKKAEGHEGKMDRFSSKGEKQ